MAPPPNIIFADASFLAGLPDLRAGTAEALAVEELAVAGKLVTIAEARNRAEQSYQAVVNSHLFQKVQVQDSGRLIKAKARTLAPSMPEMMMTRHLGMSELCVAAAALNAGTGAAIVTTRFEKSFYDGFAPPLGIVTMLADALPGLV